MCLYTHTHALYVYMYLKWQDTKKVLLKSCFSSSASEELTTGNVQQISSKKRNKWSLTSMSAHKSHWCGNKIVKTQSQANYYYAHYFKGKTNSWLQLQTRQYREGGRDYKHRWQYYYCQKAMKWVSPDDFGEYNFC